MNESLLQKLKRVRALDLVHVFLLLFALLPAAVFRRRRRHLWLICENAQEAQDNGFALFCHVRARHPEIDAVYAIRKKSPAFAAVSAVGPTVEYGSFRHWIYYLAAEVNISTQKGGNPNAAVCNLFEVVLKLLRSRRVFLQHGVTKDDLPFLYYENTRFLLFCCAAQAECDFIRERFGYPPGAVRLLGFCRYDALADARPDPDLILILPTWRMWLERSCRTEEEFRESDYYRSWNAFLNDPQLDALLKRSGKRAVFCVHRNMGRFETSFSSGSDRVEVRAWDSVRVPDLLKSAAILVTDYSSVFMDFAYMQKPAVFYQFDREEYRGGHWQQGYFDYDRDGFGPVASTAGEAVLRLSEVIRQGAVMAPPYAERAERFFPLRDDQNAERTVAAIREIAENRS